MTAPENPPAFPLPAVVNGNGDQTEGAPGMTLRDYFAGQADVSAYGPVDAFHRARGHRPTIDELAAYIAEIRYIEADAMLAARSAKGDA